MLNLSKGRLSFFVYKFMKIPEGSTFTCNPIETRSMPIKRKDIQLKLIKQEDESAKRLGRWLDSDPNIRIKAMKAKPKYKRK